MDLYWKGPERRITGLTVKIIGINAGALVMLLIGVLYLSQYQSTLIEARLQTFKTQVELVAAALSEGVIEETGIETAGETPINLAKARRMVAHLGQTMDQRIYLFDRSGRLLADSSHLPEFPSAAPDHPDERHNLYAVQVLKNMAGFVLKLAPQARTLPSYPEASAEGIAGHPDAMDAIEGAISISAWRGATEKDVLLSAAAPLMYKEQVAGVVMLTREGEDISQDVGDVWLDILTAFALTLIITTLLSIYLSNVIANPLRRLADAAERVRKGKSKDTEIPDLSFRNDEIGELSIVLREMTQALWERMDSIENFAADVAHELKNPLTSLNSAVETALIVKKEEDRAKLLQIIKHDIERMNRLIGDISNASRLDAELSRAALEPVNIRIVLSDLIEAYNPPQIRAHMDNPGHKSGSVRILLNEDKGDMIIWGLPSRVAQIFDNLIGNAVSFSPPEGVVTVSLHRTKKTITVTVEDQGPGIPGSKLETVFERFYSERPQHEAYGIHSGLGLSICRQIVTALGGQIFAENVHNEEAQVTGARFTVILNAV